MTDKAGETRTGDLQDANRRIAELEAELAAEKAKVAELEDEDQMMRWYRDQALVSANAEVEQLEEQVRMLREACQGAANVLKDIAHEAAGWMGDEAKWADKGLREALAATEPKEEKAK